MREEWENQGYSLRDVIRFLKEWQRGKSGDVFDDNASSNDSKGALAKIADAKVFRPALLGVVFAFAAVILWLARVAIEVNNPRSMTFDPLKMKLPQLYLADRKFSHTDDRGFYTDSVANWYSYLLLTDKGRGFIFGKHVPYDSVIFQGAYIAETRINKIEIFEGAKDRNVQKLIFAFCTLEDSSIVHVLREQGAVGLLEKLYPTFSLTPQ